MVRIATAVSRPLACHFTQFGFMGALALRFNVCHRASAGSCAIALAAYQAEQMLASEIQRAQHQVKIPPANQSPRSENSFGRLLRGISVAHTVFVTAGAEKKHRTGKTEFLACYVTLKG